MGFLPLTFAVSCWCPLVSASWVLAWADEFGGGEINKTNWNVYSNVSEGRPPTWNQIELYTEENVRVENGALVLSTRQQNITFQNVAYNVTSGRVDSANKRNVTFGRLEISAQLQNDAASGIHTAHWLLGYSCWPRGGEIDIMECQSPHNAYSAAPQGAAAWQQATSTYHYGTQCGVDTHKRGGTSAWPPSPTPGLNFSSAFNVFAVEWNATDLVFFINQQQVNHVYSGMPGWSGPLLIPYWPMYIILSQAYMAKRPYGNPPPWAWPIEQRIDFVRLYEWQ
jgi:beta-glucanase (GH16 family)